MPDRQPQHNDFRDATKVRPYRLMFDFSGADVAAGGSATTRPQLESGFLYKFVQMTGAVWTSAAVNSKAVAGQMMPRKTMELATAANQLDTLNNFRLAIRSIDTAWESAPLPFDQYCGTAEQPMIFVDPVLLPGGIAMTAQFYNDSAVLSNIRARVVMHGVRIQTT